MTEDGRGTHGLFAGSGGGGRRPMGREKRRAACAFASFIFRTALGIQLNRGDYMKSSVFVLNEAFIRKTPSQAAIQKAVTAWLAARLGHTHP